jgi:anaphase-promoting complex subunit 3
MADELEEQMIAKTEELAESKQGEEAVEEASELVSLDPQEPIAWFMKGRAHYASSQFEEALSCFSKAASLDRQNPAIWHMIGYTLISLNRLGEAEEALNYVKSAQPTNAEAICALGICQVMQNKPSEARKNIELALSINKQTTIAMLEHFHDKFFSTSQETSSSTKAIIERMLETLKIR